MRGLAIVWAFFVVMLAAGCDPVAIKRVSVRFPTTTVQSEMRVSVDPALVNEALGMVDKILISEGFDRVWFHNETNQVAGYRFRLNPNELGIRCSVSLKDQGIEVLFSERARFNSSKKVKQTCALIHDQLGDRFGKENVK